MTPTAVPPTATPTQPPAALAIHELKADVPRDQTVSQEDAAAVVAADGGFAFDLYQKLRQTKDGNFFFSPYSVSEALSMTYAGAGTLTSEQMASVLGIDIPAADWHTGRNSIDLQLTDASNRYVPDGAKPTKLAPINTVFGQENFPFENDWLSLLARDYGAGMQVVDFRTDPEACRQLINQWVSDQTNGRIKELLPKGSVINWTSFVLINAIYMRAAWTHPFDADNTDKHDFTLLSGSTVSADEMHQSIQTLYAAGDGWKAVELPYVSDFSMLVVVPDGGRFAEVERGLDYAQVQAISDKLADFDVTLALPKWESKTAMSMKSMLEDLGMSELFKRYDADLTGIADMHPYNDNLFVSLVLHQANVTVDEKGTEAAAATAVIGDITGGPGPANRTLTIDRPFIYLIRDNVTGEILFLGRVLDPTAG